MPVNPGILSDSQVCKLFYRIMNVKVSLLYYIILAFFPLELTNALSKHIFYKILKLNVFDLFFAL
jgi:hypothetical protein